MIRLIGSPITRAQRVLWMLEEIALPYELVPAGVPTVQDPKPLASADEIRRLNPSGKVPVLVDGDFALTESFAINLYLAHRYPSALSPRGVEEWGGAAQWTAWIATEIEHDLTAVTVIRRSGLYASLDGEGRRHDALLRFGLQARLADLDVSVAERAWLVGDRFTVADLNVAAALALARPAGVDFGPVPNAARWLDRCLARDAARTVWGKVVEDARAAGFVGDLDVPAAV